MLAEKTDNGNIFLYLCENISCNLDANTISGEISTGFDSFVGSIENKKYREKLVWEKLK